MKVVLAQTNIQWEDKDSNIRNARDLVSLHKDADLIMFPEMSFTGFSMNTEVTKEDGKYTIDAISDIAVKNNVCIGFGWVKVCGEKCENHYTVVDERGHILSDYAKIHPFSYSGEDKYFSSGTEIATFDINGIFFSTFICYDLRFPELFRAVADKVHAIIVPANWPAKRSEHWKTLLRARAIENQVYIFAINCVGDIGGQYYSGDSCIANPNGDVLDSLSNMTGNICYELLDDVETFRKGFPVLKDRRTELYKELMQ